MKINKYLVDNTITGWSMVLEKRAIKFLAGFFTDRAPFCGHFLPPC
jgi:hypothetical protein